jgi:hypothetical protein
MPNRREWRTRALFALDAAAAKGLSSSDAAQKRRK